MQEENQTNEIDLKKRNIALALEEV